MDKHLKNLRKEMISKELRGIKFENQQKQNVMHQIKKKDKSKRLPSIVPKMLSVLVVAALFIVSGTIMNNYLLNDRSSNADSNSSPTLDQDAEIINETKDDQKIENLTKEDVHLLLLNTVDKFNTVKGSYRTKGSFGEETVEYMISLLEGQIGSYVTTDSSVSVSANKTHEDRKTTIFNGKEILELMHNSKEYLVTNASSVKDNGPITLDQVYGQTENGEPTYMYRNHPYAGSASGSIYPYEIATNFLEDHEKWDIEEQATDFLNRQVVIIKGKLNEYSSLKKKGSTFRFWVDRHTGILLKYEIYNQEEDVVEYLVTDDIQINQEIDNTKFLTSTPEGYSEHKAPTY